MIPPSPPLVSVIIPTFNRASMLEEALVSVQRQTVQHVELIVVDDGSSDQTAAVVKRCAPGAIYLRQEHRGVAAARNAGIQQARAAYVAFLDSDDLWLPHKLERQLEYLLAHPEVGLLYARMWSYHVDDRMKRRLEPRTVLRSFEQLLNGPNTVTTSTVIVRRTCLDTVGLFNPTLPAVEDHELWLRVARRFAIGFLDEPVAEYRRHSKSTTSDLARLHEGYRRYYEIILELYRDDLGNARATERSLAKLEYLCGTAALRRGKTRSALALISRGLSRDLLLGGGFATPQTPWNTRLWLPIKPYLALLVSLGRVTAASMTRQRVAPPPTVPTSAEPS